MAKKPADRFGTCGEFVAALREGAAVNRRAGPVAPYKPAQAIIEAQQQEEAQTELETVGLTSPEQRGDTHLKHAGDAIERRPLARLVSDELGVLALGNTTTIGRAHDHSLVLEGPEVSRDHASIVWDDEAGYYVLTDLGSSWGTWLNGADLPPREPKPLHDGDTLEIAGHRFRLSIAGAEP